MDVERLLLGIWVWSRYFHVLKAVKMRGSNTDDAERGTV
jgi:hypothetical protein